MYSSWAELAGTAPENHYTRKKGKGDPDNQESAGKISRQCFHGREGKPGGVPQRNRIKTISVGMKGLKTLKLRGFRSALSEKGRREGKRLR